MKGNRAFQIDRITIVILSLAILKILLHLYTNLFAGYGIFRDELYYIACSKRPDSGYVDHPPFSIFILDISRYFLGESLFAIRLLPALAGGYLIYMTGLITRKAGGGINAVVIACTAVFAAPLYFAMFSFYSMNFLDYIFWITAGYLVLQLIEEPRAKQWLLLGFVLGLGALNKISILWLWAAVFSVILFTPLRNSLKTPWPYLSAIIAVIIFQPYVIWNITHNYAHIEFINNATNLKYSGITRLDFITGAVLTVNPVNLVIWLPGLIYLLFIRARRENIVLALLFLIPFIILLANAHSKSEYIGPAFPFLFAGGGIFFEKVIIPRISFFKYLVPAIVGLSGIIVAPFGIPVLPVDKFIAYSSYMGIVPSNPESKELSKLPQFYADMFGWENMARTVSRVYTSLSDDEKKNTVVFALNYGEAGAIEYYSKKYPLPKVVSPHNNYWYWGKENLKNVSSVIVIGGDPEDHRKSCGEVTEAAKVISKYAMPYETNLPLYICRKIKRSLNEIWRTSRFFI